MSNKKNQNDTEFEKKIKRHLNIIKNSSEKSKINKIVKYLIEHKNSMRNNKKIDPKERVKIGEDFENLYNTHPKIYSIISDYINKNLLKQVIKDFFKQSPNNITSSNFTNILLENITSEEKYIKAKEILNKLIKKNATTVMEVNIL